ncbi:DoxX family protein [Sphingomicrobium clamense]|uniref:DoxX family protein n=1 Tax=Sphingomicrobium clamense TaxID=2851013 RepID=UPI0031F335C8
MTRLYDRLTEFAARPLIRDIVLLFVRIALAAIFWRSGRTKIEEGTWFDISETTFFLFENEYSGVPLPPEFSAYAATAAEHVLPLLLVFGLASRFAAAGLIAMTLVIQLFVYPDAWWSPHMSWIALGLVILTQGPGRVSFDHAISGRLADR